MSEFRIPTRPGFMVCWKVPEERINKRTGKTYIKDIDHGETFKYRANAEKLKAKLEADGFTVKIYECFY